MALALGCLIHHVLLVLGMTDTSQKVKEYGPMVAKNPCGPAGLHEKPDLYLLGPKSYFACHRCNSHPGRVIHFLTWHDNKARCDESSYGGP